ncbi:MAG: CotS family spore coat protein [Clostridia bacterium]|nr:CotS family spore coat protein [Clostridia bacterium]
MSIVEPYLKEAVPLEEIFKEYNLVVEDLEKVKENLWKIATDRGTKGMKKITNGESRLRYIHSVQEHLADRGLRTVVRFIMTKHGLPYAFGEPGEQYVIFDWIDGKHPDLTKEEHRRSVVMKLAQLHIASEGLQLLNGSAVINNRGHWVKKFQYRCVELLENALISGRKQQQGELDVLYNQHVRYYYQQGLAALNQLDSPQYQELVKREEEGGCFCHRDFGARNLLLDYQWQVYVLDFEYAINDLRVYDLGRFLRTLVSANQWNWELGREILDTYTGVRPLTPEEKHVLIAFLTFPRTFWVYSGRYYRGDNNYPEKEILRKLKHCLEEEGQRVAFLNQLVDYPVD